MRQSQKYALSQPGDRPSDYDPGMDETAPGILEIGLVLLGAVAAGWVARRIGLPAVVGYLALGLAVSPFTPGFVADRERLQFLANLGVVLLLFEVGIEVDPLQLRREQRGLLVAAPVQVMISTIVSGGALLALGVAPLPGAVLGLCVALSSSVVIANMTRSTRRTTDRSTETTLLGWSVLQDLTGVTIAAVLLASVEPNGRGLILTLLGLVAFTALAICVAGILPRVLRAVAGQPDFFLIVSVASGFALAGGGSVVFGVPLALAAFVGGLAVAESPESAEARRRLLPFRDLLAVLFFVSIGTLVDPVALGRGLGWLAVFIGLIVVAKVGVAYALVRLFSLKARPAQTAIGMGQVGEFSFVLASALIAADSIGAEIYSALLAAVAITIAASSVLVKLIPRSPSPVDGPA
jgi:monovalent cation:H+ antiporter-2, CPA2 family